MHWDRRKSCVSLEVALDLDLRCGNSGLSASIITHLVQHVNVLDF